MNKHLRKITLTLLLILPFILEGQIEKTDKYDIGFGIGGSINNVFNHTVESADFEAKLSPILFTVNTELKLDGRWGMLAELDYIHKGPKNHDINYLILSVLPKYQISKKLNLSFAVGPYIGYLFRYNLRGQELISDVTKRIDIGLDAGIIYSKKLNEKFDIFISPRIEVGAIRFSYSNHISGQLKVGLILK